MADKFLIPRNNEHPFSKARTGELLIELFGNAKESTFIIQCNMILPWKCFKIIAVVYRSLMLTTGSWLFHCDKSHWVWICLYPLTGLLLFVWVYCCYFGAFGLKLLTNSLATAVMIPLECPLLVLVWTCIDYWYVLKYSWFKTFVKQFTLATKLSSLQKFYWTQITLKAIDNDSLSAVI